MLRFPLGNMGRSNEATGAPEIVSGNPIPGSVDEKGPEFFDEKPAPDEIDPNTGGLAGVEKIEALTQTWTKPWLIAAYILCATPCVANSIAPS